MNRSEVALVKNFACYKPFKGKLPLKYLFTNINNDDGTDNGGANHHDDDNNDDDRRY